MNETQPDQDLKTQFRAYYRSNLILHVIFFTMALAVIVCSFVMTSEGQTTVRVPGIFFPMPETCMSRRAWGIDCPGCGLTRSFISMSHGQFSRAISFNAAGPIVYLFVLIQIPWHAYQYFRIVNLRQPVESVWLYSGLFIISGATFLQWIYRVISGDIF